MRILPKTSAKDTDLILGLGIFFYIPVERSKRTLAQIHGNKVITLFTFFPNQFF